MRLVAVLAAVSHTSHNSHTALQAAAAQKDGRAVSEAELVLVEPGRALMRLITEGVHAVNAALAAPASLSMSVETVKRRMRSMRKSFASKHPELVLTRKTSVSLAPVVRVLEGVKLAFQVPPRCTAWIDGEGITINAPLSECCVNEQA